MLGTLRLVLAVIVLLSHTGLSIGHIEIGVVAVAVFFIISGYAMTGLIQNRFSGPGGTRLFYLERFVRLAPQYYLWLALALIVTIGLAWYPVNMAGFVPYGLLAYLTVIPLGLQGLMGLVGTLVMSQATTLGVEITFYVVAPWLLAGRWRGLLIGLACLVIYDVTERGVLTPALYTYYTSPGPLPLFLMGSFLFKKDWRILAILTLATVGILCFGLNQPFNLELLIGIVLGLPLVAVLGRLRKRKWDAMLGDASYGCYLGHVTVNVALLHLLGRPLVGGFTPLLQIVSIALGCLTGYASYLLVERPTLSFRRKFRTQARSQTPDAPGVTP